MTEREMFEAALELPLADRDAYLDRVCETDGALRQRLAGLLGKHDRASSFLEEPAVPALTTLEEPAVCEQPGALIGVYKLLEQIGEGGFGVVFMAEQQQPIRRKVALKVLKPGMDTRQIIARFEAERQALALMEHPNIAQVFDGGETDSGRPYFVMELVKGLPITEFCDQSQLTPKERLELFVSVCKAVQHAHQKGIIHRDIKPTNLLVTLRDGTPLVKVIDFGIAKALGPQLTDKTLFTNFAHLVGTPLYMSPEQAALSSQDVDTRSDIYSLGVLLYELLTGTTPFDKDRLQTAGYDEMRRIIREEEPPKPSTRLSTLGLAATTVSAQRRTDPQRLFRLCRGELDWIVMKALEKDRNRRYETVSAFAADAQRYLNDEPVLACPPSVAYRFRKFARRNKAALAISGVVILFLVSLVAGLAVNNWMIRQEQARTQAALTAEAKRRKQARDALDSMTSVMMQDLLAKQPVLGAEHKKFLIEALTAYEEFAADTGQDKEGRLGVAQSYHQLARIRDRLAPSGEAEAAFREALKRYAQLAADFPDSLAIRLNLAGCQIDFGILLKRAGRLDEAEPLYREGVAMFRRLATEYPANSVARRSLALNLSNVGNLLTDLGRFPDAEVAFRESLDLRKQLATELSGDPKYLQDLADTHYNLGSLLRKAGRPAEADTAFRDAAILCKQLVRDFPTVPEYRRVLAKSQNSIAVLLMDKGKHQEAIGPLQQACELLRQLAAEVPADPEYRDDLTAGLNDMAVALMQTNRLEPAALAFREAVSHLKQLAAAFPSVRKYRHGLAGTSANLGDLLGKMGQYHEAEAAYTDALSGIKQLARESPGVPDYQCTLADTLSGLAGVRGAQQQLNSMRDLLEEALPFYQAALKVRPKHPMYRSHYCLNRSMLMNTLVELGDHRAAAAAAEQLVQVADDPVGDYYDAACALARCIALVDKNENVHGDKRKELTQAYAGRAVELLQLAVKNGFKDIERLKKDKNLDSLRGRDEFKKTVAELEERAKLKS
jgi:serine/threonine protein kinase/tetratricopeptide (TPR) repeat protein